MNPDLIAAALGTLALAICVLIGVLIHRADQPTPAVHRPRHRPDTVELHWRPENWMPPTAEVRTRALLDETQYDMPAINPACCRCDRNLCNSDDTGQHCETQACGWCLNGCPAPDDNTCCLYNLTQTMTAPDQHPTPVTA